MKEKKLLRLIGNIADEYIAEADVVRVEKRKYRWITAAVCAILIIAAGYAVWLGRSPAENGTSAAEWKLERSTGDIHVTEVTELPEEGSVACLAYLTEEELVTQSDTNVFRGTIADIQNICIADSEGKKYYGIITVKVSEVYRDLEGCEAGQDIRILTEPIRMDGIGTFGMDTMEKAEIGMEGIFIARPYAAHESMDMGSGTLIWKDIADCELPDGVRHAFLQKKGILGQTILYDKDAYPSVWAAERQDMEKLTLDDVAAVIQELLQK
ncbi:MAG: hypothetical protein Q4C40_04510 [Eubacteriales bacterium]|nr:hypothetical protein [Eubacteriales bacterium]